jgi:ABC-type polysaccharide/polyol phosphate transport system ATPase subunit
VATAVIEVDDVAKRFRLIHQRNSTLKATVFSGFRRSVHEEFWALKGVTFEVEEGTTYGLIGHNGSGKSTLLKCIARIYRPDRGRVVTRGRMSALLELGAGFHPELSGRENVYLNGSILGMSRREIDRRFSEIVEFAGLEQFIDSPVKNYSSGMYVRLGFSVAITVEPDVLLIDEILAVGDESFQQRCLEKFADLRRSGRTIVLVSHGLDAVRNICDRAAWLDHGSLVKEGEAHDVVTAYLESVRDDRRAHEQASGRLVSREEAEGGWHIRAVHLVDATGRDVDVVDSGADLTIRLEIEVARDETVALAVGLYRTDGVHVAGPVYQFHTGSGGPRTLDYRIPSLRLTAGTYDVSARLLDSHLARTHAVRRRAARLDVNSDSAVDIGGLIAFGGRWTITDGR